MRVYALYGRKAWVAILYAGVAVCSTGIAIVSFRNILRINSVVIGHSGLLSPVQKLPNLHPSMYLMDVV